MVHSLEAAPSPAKLSGAHGNSSRSQGIGGVQVKESLLLRGARADTPPPGPSLSRTMARWLVLPGPAIGARGGPVCK
jgi:hypothetical protein